MVDGLQTARVRPIIDAAVARFEHFNRLGLELKKARRQLDERKIIDKAKGIVMTQRGLTEEQAYRAINWQSVVLIAGMLPTSPLTTRSRAPVLSRAVAMIPEPALHCPGTESEHRRRAVDIGRTGDKAASDDVLDDLREGARKSVSKAPDVVEADQPFAIPGKPLPAGGRGPRRGTRPPCWSGRSGRSGSPAFPSSRCGPLS